MEALFVVGSQLDNAALVAREIASGLGSRVRATVAAVSEAPVPPPGTYDLILVGATRDDHGLLDWVRSLPPQQALLLAAYDVRPPGRIWPRTSASAGLARALRRLGASSVVMPRTFYEVFANGPLVHRELGRAGDWGRVLGLLIGANPAGDGVVPAQRPRTPGRVDA